MGKNAKKSMNAFYLPPFLKRHSIIEALLRIKLISAEQLISFNRRSLAYLNLNDPEPRNVFLKCSFDPDFFSIARSLISPSGVFFDLGANHGLCSFGLLPDLSSVHFHLFEANESLVRTIQKSTALHKESIFFVNHACVSDEGGYSKFHLEPNQTGQSHVATKLEMGIEIRNLVLDQYCRKNGVRRIDFAKIDLEGHELSALKGWESYLRNHAVRALYVEIMPENQKRYGFKTNIPLVFLESLGYDLFLCKEEDFANFGEKPKKYQFDWGTLILSKFQAKNFPENFATDVLAVTPQNHQT
jgi:FkbM family methyltransferase